MGGSMSKADTLQKTAAGGGRVVVPTSYAFIAPISLGMGMCFGFALEKGRVFEPSVITDQMLLLRFQVRFTSRAAVLSAVLSL